MAASASSIRAGGAYIELLTDPKGLDRGLKDAQKRVAAFGKSVSEVGKKMSLAGGLVGGAVGAPLALGIKQFADAGSALNDMSERTGVSVEALSALKFAAQQSGTDLGSVEVGLRKMAKALQAGSEENLQAESTFVALGLSVRQLQALNPEQQFNAIASAIGQIPNPTARAAAAMQVFGKSGTSLLPMIKDLPALTDDAKRLGLVMSTQDAQAADKLGDSIDAAKASLGRIVEVVGAALAPLLTEVAGAVIQIAKTTTTWVSANKPLLVTIFKVGAGIAAAGGAMLALGAAIKGIAVVSGTLASVLGLVGSALGVLTSPVVVIAAGLGILAYKFTDVGKAGSKAVDFLGDKFGSLLVDAQDTFKGIADALKSGDVQLAAKILWAGIHVEWLQGTQAITKLLDNWGVDVKSVLIELNKNAASNMTDFWAWMQGTAVRADKGIRGAFREESDALATGINAFAEAVGAAPEGTSKILEEDQKRAEEMESDKEKKALADIENERKARQKILDENAEAERANRQKQKADELAAANKSLADAQANLKKLTDEAKNKASNVKGLTDTSQEGGNEGEEGMTPEGLDKAIEKTKSKVDVAGSFSAASIAGLGAGESIQNEQLGEQKKTNSHLESLRKDVNKKKAVWG